MKNSSRLNAFTLIELLVVISIIAILASIALPVFSEVQVRGAQTKDVSNVKQILLACRLYAMDHSEIFPGKVEDANGNPTAVDCADANACFAELIPDYIKTEQLFYVPKSAFSPVPPDEKFDNPANKLTKGENQFAYVLGLNPSSAGGLPLMADGFADPAGHTYVEDDTKKGGVWKAKKAVVGRVDGGAESVKLSKTFKVPGSPNGSDLFDDSGQAGWLGTNNKVVNPL